ncbi:MAG: outer membrane protein assembly factor BamA [Chlorobi bacterium]|nr:outer membrane protein assembly factor BamA [Chlorobiota bacterium]
MGMWKKFFYITPLLIIFIRLSFAQNTPDFNIPTMDYSNPQQYEIAGITISGVEFLDKSILVQLTGLKVGQEILIPGEAITKSLNKLWKQGLFSDIKITYTKIEGTKIYLDYYLKERPRLSKFKFTGIRKSEKDDLQDKINLLAGSQVTENIINNATKVISDHYIEKGFLDVKVSIRQEKDPRFQNSVILVADIDKGNRVKIGELSFVGNKVFPDKRLRRVLKKTKKKNLNFFKTSKLVESEYKEDKKSLVEFYNKNGYRDFKILGDTIYPIPGEEARIGLILKVYEGDRYYFRNITWVGNTKYTTQELSRKLGIKKGDPYDLTTLNERVNTDEDAVSSLYMDAGYLFSQIIPVEKHIENDSVDIEMRIYEGEPATIDKIMIRGNTKTNEHVVRRELRTMPGELFSKTDIIRSVRELAQLGHFDPEKISPNPIPNPSNGTVDLEYDLTEKANDQFEISGGWGAGMLVGTIGLRFNNFSVRNLFNGKAWRPIPTGDGQSVSLRAQSNGRYYQAYSFSFVEPWFGGKKPNAFSFSLYHTIQSNGRKKTDLTRQGLNINGATIGLQKRLKWPDDYFTLYTGLSFQNYILNNWNQYFLFSNGNSNNVSFTTTFGRFSAGPNPIYPTLGSNVSLSLQVTPPFSAFNSKNYADPEMTDSERYRWIEYHKWTFKSDWYLTLAGKLVLYTRAHFGYLGYYNRHIGPSPFEGFDLGGDGITGYNLYGRETIALRGYENGSLTPIINNKKAGNMYERVTMELRYPITLQPQATVFILGFLEGGNAWYRIQDFNPFGLKRSAGIGLRAFLPMFGLLGIDWGYGFNSIPGRPEANGSHFHFVIGQEF